MIDISGHDPVIAYLRAQAQLGQKAIGEALENAELTLAGDPGNWKAWELHGEILNILGRPLDAIHSLDRALELKRELPSAYWTKATILLELSRYQDCLSTLKKAYYYDNTLTKAYILSRMLSFGNAPLPSMLREVNSMLVELPQDVTVRMSRSVSISIEARVPEAWQSCEITALQPYGFGVDATVEIDGSPLLSPQRLLRCTLTIEGCRDSSVNIGRPWDVNIVMSDPRTGFYSSSVLRVKVLDEREGELYFVPTEDLEVNSAFFHGPATDGMAALSVNDAVTYFVSRLSLADSIGNSYGVKWSHMLDIGSGLLQLRWLAASSARGDWQKMSDEADRGYVKSISSGNDVQLHLHAYNLPDSDKFAQTFDMEKDRLLFGHPFSRDNREVVSKSAWAKEYRDLGAYDKPNSKEGSLFRGAVELERLFSRAASDYRTMVFRAGEYDFGSVGIDTRDSITSLRSMGLLCSSNATHGSNYAAKDFSFAKPIGRNAYFASDSAIEERAQRLLDVGILEVVPVPKLYTMHYLQPTDAPYNVTSIYRAITSPAGVLPPGVQILMEQFHLNAVNYQNEWGRTQRGYGDWALMESHFASVARDCPRIKFATISDTVLAYYDYYTPDLIAIASEESVIDSLHYSYNLSFYGRDIRVDSAHPHLVRSKPPRRLVGNMRRVKLLRGDKVLQEWCGDDGYNDMDFSVESRDGYKLIVELIEPETESPHSGGDRR